MEQVEDPLEVLGEGPLEGMEDLMMVDLMMNLVEDLEEVMGRRDL